MANVFRINDFMERLIYFLLSYSAFYKRLTKHLGIVNNLVHCCNCLFT